jgi:hypothetical protein
VPLEKSRYRIGNKLHHFIVAYNGTFLVDPKTFDLVRLTIRADQIPAGLNACESSTTLGYGSIQLNIPNSLFQQMLVDEWSILTEASLIIARLP